MFVLALLLAVFEPGLSQLEDEDDVQVVTIQKKLKKLIKKEIANAFESFMVNCPADAQVKEKLDAIRDQLGDLLADTPTDSPVVRQVISRIENNLVAMNGNLIRCKSG